MGCSTSKPATGPESRAESRTVQSSKSSKAFGGAHRTISSKVSKRGEVPVDDVKPAVEAPVKRERRIAYGSEVVRDQLRKGGAKSKPGTVPGTADNTTEDEGEDQVSDSEGSDDDEAEQLAKREHSAKYSRLSSLEPQTEEELAIAQALQKSIVFSGISSVLLCQVVHSMCMQAFPKGETILRQGATVGEDDFMYLLESGDVDVVISGGHASSEAHKVEGNAIKIRKTPGWLFGDVALLFGSTRSASVVAATDVLVWSLDRRSFLKFVLHHAPGVRRLRFIRKLPLLKGLSDQVIIKVGESVKEEVFQDGQALVRHGETGTNFFVIRYGKVRVLRPQPDGTKVEVCILRRGQFVGERTLITGQLRSADCVAMGQVTAVALSKRQFVEIDNPLLSWMLDYDAVASVLRICESPGPVNEEKLDTAIELFEREELPSGSAVLTEGQACTRLYIVRGGSVQATAAGEPATLRQAGGFFFFGDHDMMAASPSSVTVKVMSESATLLSITRAALMTLLGLSVIRPLKDARSPGDADFVKGALLRLPSLKKHLADSTLQSLAEAFESHTYDAGDVITIAGKPADRIFVVKSGGCVLSQKELILDKVTGRVNFPAALPGQRLGPGTVHSQMKVMPGHIREASMVALKKGTEVLSATREAAVELLGSCLELYMALRKQETLAELSRNGADASAQITTTPKTGFGSIRYVDLTRGRIIGTGQFGMVRIVQHRVTGEPYALKCIHKAPITQLKQVDHTVNERRLLEAISSDFTVRLLGAYQDETNLMLLQEWVGGGELFHHLDKEGFFDESTACFYAANVVVGMSQLHAQGIVYRDLKPENLLVDAKGYIKMADFGFAKYIGDRKTFTICGTPDYQAPEVILRKGTDKAADYWAIGVLIFEMLVGEPPFKSITGDPWDTFRRAMSGRFSVPPNLSYEVTDLIYKLLNTEPSKRLGSGPDGAAQVKRHPWFSRLDWAALEARTLRAPMVPTITDPLDTSNFDEFDDVDTSPQPMNGPDRNAAHWEGLWDWVNQPVKRMNSSRKYVRSLSRREQMRAESTVPGTLDEHSSDEED